MSFSDWINPMLLIFILSFILTNLIYHIELKTVVMEPLSLITFILSWMRKIIRTERQVLLYVILIWNREGNNLKIENWPNDADCINERHIHINMSLMELWFMDLWPKQGTLINLHHRPMMLHSKFLRIFQTNKPKIPHIHSNRVCAWLDTLATVYKKTK